ncbi:MAG: arsenate reductase ArsC [Pirellulales bacterium]|nr:arsenate reductase ArsC [Pirellulales bacterium]
MARPINNARQQWEVVLFCYKNAKNARKDAHSTTHGLDPRAVRVMNEAGVDISAHWSKNVRELAHLVFDVVVTVCDHAAETCPTFPGNTRVIHAGFNDPPRLASGETTEEETLDHYRRVRDQIRTFVQKLPEVLTDPAQPPHDRRE